MPQWNVGQYVLFEDERTRPARDLLAHVATEHVKRAIDVGCGPGNSTEVLAACCSGASISGFDRSLSMIIAARKRLPHLSFELSTVEDWKEEGPFDLILSNATLHWVPDHATLLPSLMQKLSKGGSLAIQMPDNLQEPSHRLMRQIATDGPWAGKLKAATSARTAIEEPSWYYETLKPHSKRVDIWKTVYYQVLAGGPGAIVEWFKGSGLRPFLDALSSQDQEGYLQRYTEEIARAYPAEPDGSVLLPFPRLFIVATR